MATNLLETLFGVTKDNPYDAALARIDEEIAAVKLGLHDTERPIYAAHDTMPAPSLPDFGELTLPAPEVPPTLEELPADEEDAEPEECTHCNGSGIGACLVPPSWGFPGEFADCENCGGEGVL